MVGKREQVHVLTARLAIIKHDMWIIHEYQAHSRIGLGLFTTRQLIFVSICEYFQIVSNRLQTVYSLCRTSSIRKLSSKIVEVHIKARFKYSP